MKDLVRLLRFSWAGFRNGAKKKEKGSGTKRIMLTFIALVFLVSIFSIFRNLLGYFNAIPMFGNLLIWKLLGMVFLSFMFMLLFSNVIVTISTFYLSDDMPLLLTMPLNLPAIIVSRFVHTIINSSWMVLAMGVPIFAAYTFTLKGSIMTFFFSMAIITIFLITIASLSISFAMSLISIFPARRTRDLFMLLSIAVISFIVVMFRMIKPERFTDVHELAGFSEFMKSFEAPDAPYLPSGWAANAITAFFKYNYTEAYSNSIYLAVASVISVALMIFIGNKLYMKGWWNTAENQLQKYKKKKIDAYDLRKLFPYVRSNIIEVAVKDIKNFVRDSSQWPQLMMLLSVVIIYLFNVTNLPLDRLPANVYAKYIHDIIFFLNMGFAGFIIAAVAARFVFSSISLEGKAFWVIRTSPLSIRKFIWEKYWMSFFPLLLLSELLIGLSIYFLKVDVFMGLVSAGMVFFFSFCISSLGVGIGAIYPKFRVDNTADIAASYGGIIYMIFSMLYVGISIVLVAIPVNAYYSTRVVGTVHFSRPYIIAAMCIFLFIQIVAFVLPMYLGERSLNDLEI